MFAKVLILALLGSSLVAVNSFAIKAATKAEIRQKWISSIDGLAREFDKKSTKTYDDAQRKLEKILAGMRGKNDEAVAIAEEKMAALNTELEELKTATKRSIEEKKTTVLAEIDALEGEITKQQEYELRMKHKSILKAEERKFKTPLKAWAKKAKAVREEAAEALKEVQFQDFLNELKLKYGEIYDAHEQELLDLRDKYVEVKRQGEMAVEELIRKYEKELEEVMDQPEKYYALRAKARRHINAERRKYWLRREMVKQEFRDVVEKMEIEKNEGEVESGEIVESEEINVAL